MSIMFRKKGTQPKNSPLKPNDKVYIVRKTFGSNAKAPYEIAEGTVKTAELKKNSYDKSWYVSGTIATTEYDWYNGGGYRDAIIEYGHGNWCYGRNIFSTYEEAKELLNKYLGK